LAVEDAGGVAGGVAEVEMFIDAAIDNRNGDAAAVEAGGLGGEGVDGGDSVLERGREGAIRRDVFDAGVLSEGGERGAGEAGGEAVEEGEFMDRAEGGEVEGAEGAGAGAAGAGGGGVFELDNDVDGVVRIEISEIRGELRGLGEQGGDGREKDQRSGDATWRK
jgi:hypothetical protein